MKKLILMMSVVIGLSACTHTVECNKNPAPRQQAVMAQPVVQPIAQASGCQGTSYTVSEPVEVLYKNTTYRPVYEPKTYSSVSYVKKPYNCAEGSLCKQKYNAQ